MEHEQDGGFFDLGDNTALVCVDHQQYQKIVVPQLIDMTYKVHLGLFEEDVLLKLQTYNYGVVVIYENFKGSNLSTNPILLEMIKRPEAQRRQHFVVLLSHRFATNDAMSAFVHSVDLSSISLISRTLSPSFAGASLNIASCITRSTRCSKASRRFDLSARRGVDDKILAHVARVPIHLARHVHHDGQHNEERDRAHKQRVILLPQRDVEKSINARQSRADH